MTRPNSRIRTVRSFAELATTRFTDGINALCWPRQLAGDFGEVARQLATEAGEGITRLDDARLQILALSPAGRTAATRMLEDQRLLREHGLSPELNFIRAYPRDEDADVIPTDVYSFHADSAPIEADTWLCTFHGPVSEGLRNDEARRHIDVPETRAKLLAAFGGSEGADFEDYLKENCYDLHYAPAPDAQPFSFGLGHLWRIAVDYPGSPVPPCIHRAPVTLPGQSRLLLIS